MGNRLLLVLGSLLILNSCLKLSNPKERNIITFESEIDTITTSIQEMNGLLTKYRKIGFSYIISNDSCLFVETLEKMKKVGCINDTLSYQNEALSFFETVNEKKKFIDLTKFLFKNHLSGILRQTNKYLYYYRDKIYMADRQEDLWRYIIYLENMSAIKYLLKDDFVKAAHGGTYNLSFKVIDQKGNLFLLAHKDAKIWEN